MEETIGAPKEKIRIPDPTPDDLAWAEKHASSWTNTLGKQLIKSARQGYVWRVNHLLELKQQGKGINLDKVEGNETAMGYAVDNGHYKIVAMLLDAGADMYATNYSGVFRAAQKDNEALWRLFFDHGMNADEALRMSRNSGYERKNLTKIILEKYPGSAENYGISDKEMRPDEKQKTKQKEDSDRDGQWEKLSDDEIVKHDLIASTGTRLQTIFNFRARQVTTICNTHEEAAPAISITRFSEIEGDDALTQAWQALKDLGGDPEPYAGRDKIAIDKKKAPTVRASIDTP